jgi:thiol-disulfide isomerase/thioredoxin
MGLLASHPVLAVSVLRNSGGDISVLREHTTPRDLPPIRFADMSGREFTLESFKGKVVLLNVWATWCGHCVKEMPDFAHLQATYGKQGFVVVTVSTDDAGSDAATVKVIQQFFNGNKLKLTPYRDLENNVFRLLEIVGLPTTLVIDRNGKEVARAMGPVEWKSDLFTAWLEKQLAK